MSSVNNVSDMPTDGKNLIIVGRRAECTPLPAVFDADGKRVVDTDNQLPDHQHNCRTEVAGYSATVGGVPLLFQSGKDRVITAVTSIVGPAVYYRAGGGLYGVTRQHRRLGDPHDPGGDPQAWPPVRFTRGGSPDLLTVNTGSNTLGLLAGLGRHPLAAPWTSRGRTRPGRPRGRLQPRRDPGCRRAGQ